MNELQVIFEFTPGFLEILPDNLKSTEGEHMAHLFFVFPGSHSFSVYQKYMLAWIITSW